MGQNNSRKSTPHVRRSAARPQLPDQHERRTPRNNRAKELEPVARERGAHGMDGSRCSIGQDVPRTGAVSSSLIIANCCARAFFRFGLSGIAASSSATSLFSLCSRSISLWSRSNSRCSCPRPDIRNREFQLDWFFLASGAAKALANTFRSRARGGFLARCCRASKQSFDLAQLVAKDCSQPLRRLNDAADYIDLFGARSNVTSRARTSVSGR